MVKKSGIQITRIIILTFSLLLIIFISVMRQILGAGPEGVAPIDAFCPFGGLAAIYKFIITGGDFLRRIFASNIVLLVASVSLAVITGRFFCGWICSFGFLQELFGKLGKKIFKKQFIIPVKIDKPLRFLKYIVLVVVIFFTWKIGDLIIRPYDPFAAFANIPQGFDVFKDHFYGIIILIVVLIASIIYDRFFCKYLCPMGAFLGILNKISIFKIKRDDSTCIHCSKCSKICPVNIDVEKTDKVKSSECINCFECITVCPTKKNTMYASIFNKIVKLTIIVIIGLVVYFGIIAGSKILGIWNTSDTSNEKTILNPNDIKGSMTLKEISDTFNIDLNKLYEKLKITKDKVQESTTAKQIQEILNKDGREFEVQEVRDAVKELIKK